MTTKAWIMMLTTWSIIIFFAGRFLYKVITIPQKKDREEN